MPIFFSRREIQLLSFVCTDTLVYHNIYGKYMRIILTGDGLPLVWQNKQEQERGQFQFHELRCDDVISGYGATSELNMRPL